MPTGLGMPDYLNTKANWPITLEELIERRDQFNKPAPRGLIDFVIYLVIFISIIVFVIWYLHGDHVGNIKIVFADESRRSGPLLFSWMFFVIPIGGILSLFYTLKMKYKSFDLVCPSCSKDLEPRKNMPMAVATGHCVCGALLVSNHPAMTGQTTPYKPTQSQFPVGLRMLLDAFRTSRNKKTQPKKAQTYHRDTKANWPITLEELNERRSQWNKAELWVVARFLVGLLTPLVAMALAAVYFDNLTKQGKEDLNGFQTILAVFIFAILIGFLIRSFRLLHRRQKENMRLFDCICPSCSKELDMARIIPKVVATGHCPKCGGQLLRDDPSQTPANK